MAVTANQEIRIKEGTGKALAFPVASGEIMFQGTIASLVTASGLLAALDAANKAIGNFGCIVQDDTANATGAAATTGAGSISGSRWEASADAGDKTVRRCYVKGVFKVTLASAAQTDVGLPLYATDNFTFTKTSTSNQWMGTIAAFIDTNTVMLDLNESYAI